MKKLLLIGLLAGTYCQFASADTETENFVGVGYSNLNMDEIDGNFSGYKLTGKYGLSERFYLSGKYQNDSADSRNEIFSDINIGKIESINDSLSWFIEAGYAVVELQRQDAGDFKGGGFHAGAGLKMTVTESMDVALRVDFTDVGKVDNLFGDYSETEVAIDLDYAFSDDFSAFADLSQGQSQDSYTIGLKYHF